MNAKLYSRIKLKLVKFVTKVFLRSLWNPYRFVKKKLIKLYKLVWLILMSIVITKIPIRNVLFVKKTLFFHNKSNVWLKIVNKSQMIRLNVQNV